MSVDDRLRAGLAENAETVQPAVERRLEAVLARRHRALSRRWAFAAVGLAAAGVAAVLAVAGPDSDRSSGPVDTPPSPSATSSQPA
jgi:hypothetical protein